MPLYGEGFVIEEAEEQGESSVTLYNAEREAAKKNEWGAAMANLIVPGAGHFYLESPKRGAAYLAVEAMLFTGMMFTESSSQRFFEEARAIAYQSAGTGSRRDDDDDYWKHIGIIESSDSWNEAMDQNRQPEKKYLSDNDQWRWENSSQQKLYKSARKDGKEWHDRWSLFIGFMAVNRIVSFVDARVTARRYNRSLLSRVKFYPTYSKRKKRTGLRVSFLF